MNLKDMFTGMNIKQKVRIKAFKNEYGYFLESNLVRVYRLFILAYSKQDPISKRIKTQRHHLPKGIIDNYAVIIN